MQHFCPCSPRSHLYLLHLCLLPCHPPGRWKFPWHRGRSQANRSHSFGPWWSSNNGPLPWNRTMDSRIPDQRLLHMQTHHFSHDHTVNWLSKPCFQAPLSVPSWILTSSSSSPCLNFFFGRNDLATAGLCLSPDIWWNESSWRTGMAVLPGGWQKTMHELVVVEHILPQNNSPLPLPWQNSHRR